MTEENKAPRLYGVSTGNGNNGISHMFADYYVTTADAWRLAKLAAMAQFKPGKGWNWAKEHAEIDGEAEHNIQVMFLNPPCEDTESGEYPDLWHCSACGLKGRGAMPDACTSCGGETEESDSEEAEDGRNYSDGNGAWLLVDVFPEDEPREGVRVYDSIEEAFTAELIAAFPEKESE